EGAFLSLEAPIRRVTASDLPFVGFARERANVPDVPRVLAACRETLALWRRRRAPPMPRQFTLPDLGEGLTEAEIVAVLVREGDVIREDAPLLEVETDKAQVEIPSPIGGRVEKIHVTPGQTVKFGAVLVTFADNGAAAAPGPAQPAASTPSARSTPTATPSRAPAAQAAPARQPTPAAATAGPVAATPATRRLARELGVDLR